MFFGIAIALFMLSECHAGLQLWRNVWRTTESLGKKNKDRGPGFLSKGVLLLQDSARQHAAGFYRHGISKTTP